MNDEQSESGAPIHRYSPREDGWIPPNMEDSSMEAITAHIETHIGPINMVWHEIISDIVHIDIHQVAPSEDRPYWTLVTTGMSDLPMTTPKGQEAFAYSELMMCLPADWKMDKENFKNESYYWPVRWLKVLARFPHEYKTWLWLGHSMPNGDPPQPIHESVGFDGIVLARPKTVSTEFWSLKVRENKTIHFFAVMPVYPGEMALKLRSGYDELERRYEKRKITEIIDPRRADVSKKEWWKIW